MFCLIAVCSDTDSSVALIVISQTRQLKEIKHWMSVISFSLHILEIDVSF